MILTQGHVGLLIQTSRGYVKSHELYDKCNIMKQCVKQQDSDVDYFTNYQFNFYQKLPFNWTTEYVKMTGALIY